MSGLLPSHGATSEIETTLGVDIHVALVRAKCTLSVGMCTLPKRHSMGLIALAPRGRGTSMSPPWQWLQTVGQPSLGLAWRGTAVGQKET